MSKNLYEVLEVAGSASQETIEAAYRSLIARYHPDKVAGLGADLRALAEERARQLNYAYGILRNTERRAAYDLELHPTSSTGPNSRATAASKNDPAKSPRGFKKGVGEHWASIRRIGQIAKRYTDPSLIWVTGGGFWAIVIWILWKNEIANTGGWQSITEIVFVICLGLVVFGIAGFNSGMISFLSDIGPKMRTLMIVIRTVMFLMLVPFGIGFPIWAIDEWQKGQAQSFLLLAFAIVISLLTISLIIPRTINKTINGMIRKFVE